MNSVIVVALALPFRQLELRSRFVSFLGRIFFWKALIYFPYPFINSAGQVGSFLMALCLSPFLCIYTSLSLPFSLYLIVRTASLDVSFMRYTFPFCTSKFIALFDFPHSRTTCGIVSRTLITRNDWFYRYYERSLPYFISLFCRHSYPRFRANVSTFIISIGYYTFVIACDNSDNRAMTFASNVWFPDEN